jgi:hypothetical protein
LAGAQGNLQEIIEMPSTFTSPYATSFKTGCKNGTPCSVVVHNIAKRTNKPVNTIVKSLCNAGLCECVKFNGTWVYWPTFKTSSTSTTCNTTHANMWQNFVEWCVANNYCTPNQLTKYSTNQKTFMNFCKSFFGKQFTNGSKFYTNGSTKSTGKNWKSWKNWKSTSSKSRWSTRSTSKRRTSTKRTRKTTPHTWTRSYVFPSFKTRSTTRRYVRAA